MARGDALNDNPVPQEEIDRDQIIFICSSSMTTRYSESYLKSLSDEELYKIYDRVMTN